MQAPGEIRCGKTARGKPYPSLPGFTTILVWSRGAGQWKTLSPMTNLTEYNKILEIIEPPQVRSSGFQLTPDNQWSIGYCHIFSTVSWKLLARQ